MTKITYSQHGEYQLPNLALAPQAAVPLGKYGLMRKNYLKQHRKVFYNSLLLAGTLQQHLLEVEDAAGSRMAQMMKTLEAQNPPPDKATNQMGWVAHMNSLQHQAEEVILNDLIYS